jgi:bifunctional DNA-binding transcriptional regulator/antitoxin component of YhaV-PrlF toxin-antitoxin module
MRKLNRSSLAVTRLSRKGQLTIPAEYRHSLALSPDMDLVLVQVGDALAVVPHDEALAAVTQRLEGAMRNAGSDVDDLMTAAAEARAAITREEFAVTTEQ